MTAYKPIVEIVEIIVASHFNCEESNLKWREQNIINIILNALTVFILIVFVVNTLLHWINILEGMYYIYIMQWHIVFTARESTSANKQYNAEKKADLPCTLHICIRNQYALNKSYSNECLKTLQDGEILKNALHLSQHKKITCSRGIHKK